MAINPKVFKQVRKALGLTQEELANSLGLSRVTINKMERGKLRRGIPDDVGAKLLALKPLTADQKAMMESERALRLAPVNVNDQHLWENLEEEEDES